MLTLITLNKYNYTILTKLILVLVCMLSTTKAISIIYEANIQQQGVIVMDTDSNYIILCGFDGSLTVYKKNGNTYDQIKVQDVSVYIPSNSTTNLIAYHDAKKYLPKITDLGSFIYYMDKNTGLVVMGDLTALSLDSPTMPTLSLAGHGCTDPFKCHIATSSVIINRFGGTSQGSVVGLYSHNTRNFTIYLNNQLFLSTILNCNSLPSCLAFTNQYQAKSISLLSNQLDLQFKNQTAISYYAFGFANVSVNAQILITIPGNNIEHFSLGLISAIQYQQITSFITQNGQVLAKNCFSAWGDRQRYAQRISFFQLLYYQQWILISIMNNNISVLELRSKYYLQMSIIETARVTSAATTSINYIIAYLTADNRLVIALYNNFYAPARHLDRRPNNAVGATNSTTSIQAANSTMCMQWGNTKICNPHLSSILLATVIITFLVFLIIVVIACIALILFCKMKYEAYKQKQTHIIQYHQSTFNKNIVPESNSIKLPHTNKIRHQDSDNFGDKSSPMTRKHQVGQKNRSLQFLT